MIAPPKGGIEVYVKTLSSKLQECGISVDIKGSRLDEQPYDPKGNEWNNSSQVRKTALGICKRIDFDNYDIVAFHYGKNDIEQYFPVVLKQKKIKIKKSVYFTHFLSQNLFSSYLKDQK